MKIISLQELFNELSKHKFTHLQNHHTWKPTHAQFNGSNHIQLQKNMKNHHVRVNGWSDIGQHITIMPDGKIVTGRPFGKTGAGIAGHNTGGLVMEILGNFDIKGTGQFNSLGYDTLTGKQKETVLAINKYFIDRYGDKSIVFHREKSTKTCPGTGINKQSLIAEAKGGASGLIRFDDRGPHVKKLQENLNKLGFGVGTADGIAGDRTIKGLKDFQNSKGLSPDGIAGPNTFKAIEDALKVPKTHFADKPYNSLVQNGLVIHEKRFDDAITRGEVFVLLDQLFKKKDDLRPFEVITKDGYITIVKIRKDCIDKIEIVVAENTNNRELLSRMKARAKSDFIINGGLWWNKNNVSHSLNLLIHNRKQIQAGVYSRFGLIINKDGSFKYDWYKWDDNINHMLGGAPALIQNGKIKLDAGKMETSILSTRQPRSGTGMNSDFFFMVTVDGRQPSKPGMTIIEFANLMLGLGCTDAMAGDGGGTVRVESKTDVLNSPTENRPTNNAISIKLK